MAESGQKLTKTVVDAAAAGEKDRYIWDDVIRGFGLKITPTGRKVYLIQYRIGGRKGRTRRVTIGVHGKDGITPTKAREQAKELRLEINKGLDPLVERDRRKAALTVADAWKLYRDDQVRRGQMRKVGSAGTKRKGWKPRTLEENDRLARLFILPRFGKRPVTDVERSHVQDLHASMDTTPRQANLVVQLMSGLWGWLKRNGHPCSDNPCLGVDKYDEASIERFLNEEELARLGQALERYDERARATNNLVQMGEAAAIRLALFTGMRSTELRLLKWEYVDLPGRVIQLPDAKAGARVVPLNTPAANVLSALPRVDGNAYCFTGAKDGAPVSTLQRAWRKVREEADVKDVRLHDCRHTTATWSVTSGQHLRLIAGLLGHRTLRMVERYSHADLRPLAAASEAAGAPIFQAMKGRSSGVSSSSESRDAPATED